MPDRRRKVFVALMAPPAEPYGPFTPPGAMMRACGERRAIQRRPSRMEWNSSMEEELLQAPRSPTRSGVVLMNILREAGIGPRSVVRVAGHGALAPLIWLCRLGFADVGYIRPGVGGPREPADVLLALDGLTLAELERLIGEHGLVREGGVIVVKTPDLRVAGDRDPVHDALERAGYHVERCVHRHAQELHVARFEGRSVLARAA